MKDTETDLTAARVREVLNYDPETGTLHWLQRPSNRVRSNGIAGHLAADSGYLQVRLYGRLYRAHRLAWLLMTGEWPAGHVDHINGDRSDNRWSNLRDTDQSGNIANSRLSRANTSGFKGVTKCKGRWVAQIKKNYARYHLGVFDTPEEAHAAYCEAAKRLHGEFARAA